MAEAKIQKRNTYTIYDDEGIGTVQIADEVVAIIAGLAATEVDGVASMAGNITNELVSKLGMKNLSKGVKVDVLDGVVCVDLALNLKYGYEIPATCKNVQENDRPGSFRCQCSHCRREYGTDEIKNNEPRGNKATPYNPAVLVNYSEPDEMEEK